MAPEIVETAQRYYAERDWHSLGYLYQRTADKAWQSGHLVAAVRLLLAEHCVATHSGDERKQRESAYFLAMRHRLQAQFLPAEAWAHKTLQYPLTAKSAVVHVAALRELAAIREVAGTYDQGLEFCDEAESVGREFADAPGMTAAQVKTLLQRAVLLRLRGTFDEALDALRQAREHAVGADIDELTRGLIELREGGMQVVIGRADAALAAYEAAAQHFAGVSEHNALIAKVRQIPCLRGLGRQAEALALADELAARFSQDTDQQRLGQVLLERAEVLHELGDQGLTRDTLEQCRPLFEHQDSLEALRWHLHMARTLMNSQDSAAVAAAIRHVAYVLRVATAPGHGDLIRTMLALFHLCRMPEGTGIPMELRLAACRAALLAAELQRDSLSEPAQRWSMHAYREEIYTAAVLLHAGIGDVAAVAKITEAGRADLLNQVLTSGARPWPGTLTALPVIPHSRDRQLEQNVFTVARAICAALTQGMESRQVADLPPREVLAPDAELDELADVIVLSHLACNGSDWWMSVATRPRSGCWSVVIKDASPPVARILDQLNTGHLLPPRGISAGTWEQLGAFLLPSQEIWSGTPDRPCAVLLCPDPRLWQIPYVALTRGGIALAEVAEVTLTPSLRTSRLLYERAERRAPSGPAFGRPAASILDTGLPGHETELSALGTWPGGLQQLASVGDLADGQPLAILYVSGHGDKPGTRAELGPTRLTLDTLASHELPPFVLLNGCWSGTTDGRFGQDPFSLAVGALIGGADLVVAGIGRIGSTSSAHIAAATIVLIQQGQRIGSALRAAQTQTKFSHPELTAFDWAGLAAIGSCHQ
ncbi:MAG TPA: CHAT domain-containing protein [Acidobacteriaceae bacterium]|nr:CHAT domain-containing protein [Acidobacteriaceae bacterium]